MSTSEAQPVFPRIEKGRAALQAWKTESSRNFFDNDPLFRQLLELRLGKEKYAQVAPDFQRFGELCATALDEAASVNNRNENLPRLARYDGIGNRTESVEHHPTYRDCGKIIYGSGMMTLLGKPGNFLQSLSLFYLSSQDGEAGHNCPVACTAGIIRALSSVASPELKAKYLPRLLDPDFDTNFTGAQFLTEVQGGSDVGANNCMAREGQKPGTAHIHGEKWFCSNADANLILMTARYDESREGTRGLGLFLVPRLLDDGRPNHYTIRRLKDKLGTRSMASGEIDFQGALAFAVGPLEQGFKTVMENVIHLSRLYNTLAVTGGARRAYTTALGYARHREAFGQPIANYPLVLENLAEIRMESAAMLAAAMHALDLQDGIDTGRESDEETRLFQRLLANLNKYRSSIANTASILKAIELLGGNGAIETFSVLPRLLRDAIVCENWEGTHNTLRLQTLRDIHKLGVDRIFISRMRALLDGIGSKPVKDIAESLRKQLIALEEQVAALKMQDLDTASWTIKEVVDAMSDLYYAVVMASDSARLGDERLLDVLRLFMLKRIAPATFVRNAETLALVKRVAMQG